LTHKIIVDSQFGWASVGDKKFSKDIIIHVDRQVTERRTELSRVYMNDFFHVPLSENELGFLAEEKPEVVIIGAGFKGMMLLTPKAKETLKDYEHMVLTTPAALDKINKEGRRYVAIIHVTC